MILSKTVFVLLVALPSFVVPAPNFGGRRCSSTSQNLAEVAKQPDCLAEHTAAQGNTDSSNTRTSDLAVLEDESRTSIDAVRDLAAHVIGRDKDPGIDPTQDPFGDVAQCYWTFAKCIWRYWTDYCDKELDKCRHHKHYAPTPVVVNVTEGQPSPVQRRDGGDPIVNWTLIQDAVPAVWGWQHPSWNSPNKLTCDIKRIICTVMPRVSNCPYYGKICQWVLSSPGN